MITDKIIEDICRTLMVDKIQVLTALKQCEFTGYLSYHEVIVFVNYGIPIVQIGATMLKTDKMGFLSLARENKISYGDTCIMLGAFAQQLLLDRQHHITKQF